MTPLEKDIEKHLRKSVRAHSGLCLKWVCPGWAGVPDRIILLPGGRVIFVELKTASGKLAKRQKWWREKLMSLGFQWFGLWTHEEVKAFEALVLGGD